MEIQFSLEEIHEVAKKLLHTFPDKKQFAFYAGMGSGKTTLIRALCNELGVKDNVSSPTFSIINEYLIEDSGEKVFHMDWYRLKNAEDAVETGVQDILMNEPGYCFIEWPEIAPEILTSSTQPFSIEITSANTRTLKSL